MERPFRYTVKVKAGRNSGKRPVRKDLLTQTSRIFRQADLTLHYNLNLNPRIELRRQYLCASVPPCWIEAPLIPAQFKGLS